jgi:DNA-binding LacI/PurR family transcriptional regulator
MRDGARVTIKDVAARAGVSTATVSHALNDRPHLMRPDTLRRIRAAIRELGYVPSAAAKALRTARTDVLGLVVPSIANPFFAQFARGAEDAALARGYALFVCSSDRSPERERAYASVLFERQVDGAIFASSVLEPDHILELHRRGTRVVLLETELAGAGLDAVLFDNALGARLAVDHLIGLGHRRIAMAMGRLARHPRQARLAGYREALAAHALPFDGALLIEGPLERDASTGAYELAAGQAIAERLVRLVDRPTALFAYNDMAALGVIRGLQRLGVRVPDDVSVVGLDDIPLAELTRPALTTVAQPAYEMGEAAARLLLDRLAARAGDPVAPRADGGAGRTVRFEPRLVVRESTAPPAR